ncbi:MAG TPA: hypothetical protein VGD69_14045 [Herpetosiphonaceae bacterium]
MLARRFIQQITRVQVIASLLMLALIALSSIATRPAAARPFSVEAYACTGGNVTVLTSNAYVYGTLYSVGRPEDYLYTAPAGRGFRWCSEATTYDGRVWVWGHSAVDSRDGWILKCHLYTHC